MEHVNDSINSKYLLKKKLSFNSLRNELAQFLKRNFYIKFLNIFIARVNISYIILSRIYS